MVALLAGIAALCVPSSRSDDEISWESLLAPYSRGAPLPGGFRIESIRRGSENDVVILARGPGQTSGVEVHVLERGRWTGVRESQSFAIAYETPRSPGAEREAITEILAEIVRSRDRGLPSPDAIPLGAAFDPTATPRWLDPLRGGRGILAGTSLALLGWLAVVRWRVLAIVGIVLGAADVLARLAGLPSGRLDLGGAWTVPAAALLFFLAFRERLAGARAERLLALAVTGVALFLRFALGAWGPLHVNGYGPRFVAGAARDPAAIAAYGPGYVEIFAPIAALVGSSPDWGIFASNAAFSSLVATLAFALGRLVGLRRPAAAAAALFLAADPVAIRAAATESYFPAILFFCTAASAVLLVAAREIDGDDRRAAAGFGAGGLLLVQAARIHPSGWILVATVPLVLLAGDGKRLHSRMLAVFSAGLVAGGLLSAISGGALLDVLGNVRGGTLMQPIGPPSLVPLVWLGAMAAAYALLVRRWIVVPAVACVAGMLLTRPTYGQSWIWQQSYDRLYFTLPVVALAAAVPARVWRSRWLVGLALLVAAVAWFRLALPVATARTLEHAEYRWLRGQLVRLPPECRVIHLAAAAKRSLEIPTYVRPPSAPATALDLRRPHTLEEGLSPAPCLYYVHTSLCSTTAGRPACASIESRLALVPVARAWFSVPADGEIVGYDSDPVEVFIARAKRVEGGG